MRRRLPHASEHAHDGYRGLPPMYWYFPVPGTILWTQGRFLADAVGGHALYSTCRCELFHFRTNL
jgi:hypothetical protein